MCTERVDHGDRAMHGLAREYVDRLRENGDPHSIEISDGGFLHDIVDEVLDLYNGRIGILCDGTLRPNNPGGSSPALVEQAFRDIGNIDAGTIPDPGYHVTFHPTVTVTADTDAVFETSIGVILGIINRCHS